MTQQMSSSTYFQIGKLARQTGLTVGSLRYYSDLGLLQPAARGENGYRYYDRDAVQQVEFIKKAQTLGFSLEEIEHIIKIRDRGDQPCGLVQNLLADKIEQIETQIEQMTLFKAELEAYRNAWRDNPLPAQPQSVCPLISSVSLKG